MTHQTIPGRKAALTKVFAWGPREEARANAQAVHTGDHPHEPNPYTRENTYPVADFARVGRFKAWNHRLMKRNASLDQHLAMLLANPHSHPETVRQYNTAGARSVPLPEPTLKARIEDMIADLMGEPT